VRCCIAGADPAGMMLGYLLARAGVQFLVLEKHADLVVGANGRNSIVPEQAGLKVKDFVAPMDVLWFRLSRSPDDPIATMARFDTDRIFIMISSMT